LKLNYDETLSNVYLNCNLIHYTSDESAWLLRLKLECDEALCSTVAFNCNVRPYTKATTGAAASGDRKYAGAGAKAKAWCLLIHAEASLSPLSVSLSQVSGRHRGGMEGVLCALQPAEVGIMG
jgi:hypothetical protein